MCVLDVIFYAFIQGISEFLPISSSAHLFLLGKILGLSSIPPLMETAVHLGSLGALVIFFRQDIGRMLRGLIRRCCGQSDPNLTLMLHLIVVTLPLIFIGLLVEKTIGRAIFQNFTVIAWATLIFGGALWWADRKAQRKKMTPLHVRELFWGWGLVQCLALIHGVSRSGIVITYGRLKGYTRADTVRFAFLMALPSLAGGVVLTGFKYRTTLTDDLSMLLLGTTIAFCVGLLTIKMFIRLVTTRFLQIIGAYRIILGLALLAF